MRLGIVLRKAKDPTVKRTRKVVTVTLQLNRRCVSDALPAPSLLRSNRMQKVSRLAVSLQKFSYHRTEGIETQAQARQTRQLRSTPLERTHTGV